MAAGLSGRHLDDEEIEMSDNKTEATFHQGDDLPQRTPFETLVNHGAIPETPHEYWDERARPMNAPGTPPWAGDYNQTQLAAQHGWSSDKKARILVIPFVVIGVILCLVTLALMIQGSNVVPAWVPVVGKDSGLAACEAIAAGSGPVGSQKTSGQMTAEEYKAMRAVFNDSRYPEIGEPGVRVIDMAWQIQGMGEDAGLALLPMVGPLTESYGALTGGCAQHGVTIPSLGAR